LAVAGCKPAMTCLRQPEYAEPPQGISQGNQPFPMELGNVALGFTFADFKQGGEFFGAQQRQGIVGHRIIPYAAGTAFRSFTGGGLISAILRRQSASESWGPETNVPLIFVLYQPDTTPSQSASSVLT
jgi:hypothetical protein